jgi:hypothetical protein
MLLIMLHAYLMIFIAAIAFHLPAFGLTLPPPPKLQKIPLPAKLAGGLLLFQMSVKRKDKVLVNDILQEAQARLRQDPLITMELGVGLEVGGVFSSSSSSSFSTDNGEIRQVVMEFQINGGNSWAQATVHGVKIGMGPVRLLSLDVSNMDAALMNEISARVQLPPWDAENGSRPWNTL